MKFTEGSFMKWGYALAEREFGNYVFTWAQHKKISDNQGVEAADKMLKQAESEGKVIIKDVIADAFLQQILTRPAEYSVIATLNLNGDYISDALAAIVEESELLPVQILILKPVMQFLKQHMVLLRNMLIRIKSIPVL